MRTTGHAVCALVLLAAWAGPGRAGPIYSGTGLEGLGAFSGWFEYTATGPGSATLTVELRNTSPEANGGYLTAFAFDDPSGRISGVTLASTNPNFRLLGGTPDSIHAPPFRQFDIGASVSRSFLGGGSPRGGIGVGESATFTFALLGDGLDELTGEEFFGWPIAGPRVSFLARFRGFCNDGSDKVPGVAGPPTDSPPPPPVVVVATPEPGALALAAVALLVGCGWRAWGRAGRSV